MLYFAVCRDLGEGLLSVRVSYVLQNRNLALFVGMYGDFLFHPLGRECDKFKKIEPLNAFFFLLQRIFNLFLSFPTHLIAFRGMFLWGALYSKFHEAFAFVFFFLRAYS